MTDWLGRTVTAPAAHQLTHLVQQQQKKLVLTLTGWRRRALFGLLLTLTVIVIINLSLTLWLLRSMQFSLVNSIINQQKMLQNLSSSLFLPFAFQ